MNDNSISIVGIETGKVWTFPVPLCTLIHGGRRTGRTTALLRHWHELTHPESQKYLSAAVGFIVASPHMKPFVVDAYRALAPNRDSHLAKCILAAGDVQFSGRGRWSSVVCDDWSTYTATQHESIIHMYKVCAITL